MTTTTSGAAEVELAIGGMTCASCAARVERKLNRMDGVEATVNYATEKAKVTFREDVAVADLIATVEATGYTAREPEPVRAEFEQAYRSAGSAREAPDELRPLRERLTTAVVLAVPVIAMAMIPALQFEYWQWLSLTLAAPVVTYAAWPFHRAAWTNARHGAATMDTLISIGTSAAFLWSVWALFLGTAGMPGMTHPFELTIARGDGAGNIYLEAAAGVTAFILAGRYFEARSKRLAVHPADGTDETEVLRLAGALEHASEHPIARAVATEAADRVGSLPVPEDFANVAGLGVRGVVEGHAVLVGRERLLAEWAMSLPDDLRRAKESAEAAGRTVVAVAWDGEARAVLEVADAVKESSPEAVRRLRALGLTPMLLTGDNRAVAEAVAAETGIAPEHVIAEVLPQDKVDVVKRLQGEGRSVAMVGDGVNDAAALAQADLGLAMGTGTDAAIEAGDLTLVRGDLRVAADAIRLARRTLGTIRSNLFWAFAYNVAALPLAAAGLLNPMIAGAAMAFSSVFVVGNSLRLRRFRAIGQ
ncbi:heavy metal translocating P-type ATPase [Streptomyces sp. NPDC007920]|uniref:heavy metal translocating P-type ATPase n=1 Tax=Streptomyces sp. NPDC007920 TaxID=3364794 RepID=UPI0036E82664